MHIIGTSLMVFPFPTKPVKGVRVLRYNDLVWGVSPAGRFFSSSRRVSERNAECFTLGISDGLRIMEAAHRLGKVSAKDLRAYRAKYEAEEKKRRERDNVRWLVEHSVKELTAALEQAKARETKHAST